MENKIINGYEDINVPKKLLPIFKPKQLLILMVNNLNLDINAKRYKVLYGGRSSGHLKNLAPFFADIWIGG